MKDHARFWIGIASKEHVEIALAGGFAQFCHGKSAPARRPKKGDFVVYYSAKYHMDKGDPCQEFTAIGIITDDTPYQVEQFPGFHPFRRNVHYFEAHDASAKPLVPLLPFIKNKRSWGCAFRYGFIEIDAESFKVIARVMLKHKEEALGNLLHEEAVDD